MRKTEILYNKVQTAIDEIEKEFFTSKGKNEIPNVIMAIDNHCRDCVLAYIQTNTLYDRSDKQKLQYFGINPKHFDRPLEEVLATIAHEICHVYEHAYIHIPRHGYHDKQWEALLNDCGLKAVYLNKSKTSVGTEIPENSPFRSFVESFKEKYDKDGMYFNVVSYSSKYDNDRENDGDDTKADNADKPVKQYNRNKIKYVCPSCSCKVWGKPNLNILCLDCNETLEAEDIEETED